MDGIKNENSVLKQMNCNSMETLKKKLKEIDNRQKPPIKKTEVAKRVAEFVKKEAISAGLDVSDSFEEKKLSDKKQLIKDFPLPKSSKELAGFARCIYLEIMSRNQEADVLRNVWKEKLNQIYHIAKLEMSDIEDYIEIQKYYKDYRKKERHLTIRPFAIIGIIPSVVALILSIVFRLPLLMFVAILAIGWLSFLILYVFDLLDGIIANIKKQSEKRKNIPKILHILAWILLMPFFASVIVSITYKAVAIICLSVALFLANGLFLIFYLSDE